MKPFNLEEYLKNPKKKVVTRDGINVNIVCTDVFGQYPIVAKIEGTNYSEFFSKDGEWIIGGDSYKNLFFASEKHEGWINIYHGKDDPIVGNVIFASKEEAEESKRHCCGFTQGLYLTSVKVEWEE